MIRNIQNKNDHNYTPKIAKIFFYYFAYCLHCAFFTFYSVNERPLISGLYLIIVKNYKIIIIPNDSLNPVYPITVAQMKPQPKYQMRVVLPFKITAIYGPKHACLI